MFNIFQNIFNKKKYNYYNMDNIDNGININIEKENTLFSGVKTKENTMNLSKQSGDKELFSGVKTKENT
jgi:hypothetical protein